MFIDANRFILPLRVLYKEIPLDPFVRETAGLPRYC